MYFQKLLCLSKFILEYLYKMLNIYIYDMAYIIKCKDHLKKLNHFIYIIHNWTLQVIFNIDYIEF